MRHVVVAGAGLSGLAAAHRLLERDGGRGDLRVTVLEAGDRAGGWVGTDEVDGFLVERGADGFLAEKTSALALAKRLGIADRVVTTLPSSEGAQVVHHGALTPIPEGFSMLAPTRFRAFLRSPIVSRRGKIRALLEMALPRGAAREDESLGSFVRRRFGVEILHTLAQPLAGGIYGADPERLSLRATMPRFLDEETRSRSVILGLRAKALGNRQASGARYGLFRSFDRGLLVLVDALVDALPPRSLRLATEVLRIERRGLGFTLITSDGPESADAIVLALPASRAAKLVADLAPSAASALAAIPHGSAATVNLGFRSEAIARRLPGYGFVVPSVEGRASIAGTFASRKWPNRAPAGHELIRVFLGGPTSPKVDGSTNDALVAAARAELTALLGIVEKPTVTVVHTYPRAMPQYEVGHGKRARAIASAFDDVPRVALAGNALFGVGIPDAITTGEKAADRIADELQLPGRT